jgi:hypothetical protein
MMRFHFGHGSARKLKEPIAHNELQRDFGFVACIDARQDAEVSRRGPRGGDLARRLQRYRLLESAERHCGHRTRRAA